ncbi:hypothetical protein [Brevibacterium sp. HMSC22B09]|uniref:hypothetical protein n=1 Tax=Brevibacterium sp. HMSC22B09 TaxID=1581055 RepID=UPI000B0200B4|nr:hypothetical protein [Brevibacterium sp. HMSC22B09]
MKKFWKKFYKGLPPQIRMILGGLGALLSFGAVAVFFYLAMMLIVVMLEIPWVASGVILAVFLILLFYSNGWTKFGTLLFMGAVLISALLDVPGNPIYNAPFEKLFLEEGQYLTGEAIVEKPSQGETVVSGNNVVVDAGGEEIYDINDFLTFFYRLVLFSVIYGTLLTLRSFLPKVSTRKNK